MPTGSDHRSPQGPTAQHTVKVGRLDLARMDSQSYWASFGPPNRLQLLDHSVNEQSQLRAGSWNDCCLLLLLLQLLPKVLLFFPDSQRRIHPGIEYVQIVRRKRFPPVVRRVHGLPEELFVHLVEKIGPKVVLLVAAVGMVLVEVAGPQAEELLFRFVLMGGRNPQASPLPGTQQRVLADDERERIYNRWGEIRLRPNRGE